MNNTRLYHDTENELFFSDYRPLNFSLINYSIDELEKLLDNLQAALENTYIYHNELLAIAIDQDIRKANNYLKMKYKKQERRG